MKAADMLRYRSLLAEVCAPDAVVQCFDGPRGYILKVHDRVIATPAEALEALDRERQAQRVRARLTPKALAQ